MDPKYFDVIIVGGGPAGASCAISLAGSGLKVALVDKAVFPRDKICGDGLGVDVINQLGWMSERLAQEFAQLNNKMASPGIKIFSPDHSSLAIPFVTKGPNQSGFASPRMDFDNLLFQHAKSYSAIECIEDCTVEKIEQHTDGLLVSTKKGSLTAKLIIGADGAHSIVARQLADIKVDRKHYCAGLRMYYEGVTGHDKDNLIELHFFEELVPGYFWIFPLPDNKANVGIGMLSSHISKKKINLKEVLQRLISTHPDLKERFANARPLETVKGYGLPIGSVKRNISGERFILTGDAACLIDPFSGEGIANAIRSGRLAAVHAKNCFAANDYSAKFNRQFDKKIYSVMWKEFRVSSLLQRMTTRKWLFNLIIKKANSAKYIRRMITEALANVDKRKGLFTKPMFYFKLLFSRRK